MKITKRQLQGIIRESIDATLVRPAITDNVRLEVIDGNGENVPVQIPYYIITDALEDGLTVDGLFNEVEDYVQGNYYLNAWDFTEQSEKEISAMHRGSSMSEGKCDKASGHEGCVRKRAKGWVVLSNKTGKPWRGGGEKDGDIVYYDSESAAKKALGAYHG